MANTQIDVTKYVAIDSVTASAAGTVTNDVRVVIKEGLTKEEAYTSLLAVMNALISDRITLQ